MVDQKRLGSAYRGSRSFGAAGGFALGGAHSRARPWAKSLHSAADLFGGDDSSALLDEEFDELSCEPERLLRLANQP